MLAEHEGCLNDAAYDEQLLFAATVMHDLGLGHHAQGQARFEVEGADLAAAVLRTHGVAEPTSTGCGKQSPSTPAKDSPTGRGLLTYLTHKGVFVDIGRLGDGVADRLRGEVFNAIPSPLTTDTRTRSSITHPAPRRRRPPAPSAGSCFSSNATLERGADRAPAKNGMEIPDPMSQPSLCEVSVQGGLLPVWTQADGPTALVFLHDPGRLTAHVHACDRQP